MTVTSDRQTAYRQRKRAAGLVQLNIWCRPQDRDTIRAYAASLAEGVTSDTPVELSMTAQQKLESAIRTHKKKLDREFDYRINEQVTKELQHILPEYVKTNQRHEEVINAYKGVFTDEEYKMLRGTLHSDRYRGIDSTLIKKLNKAFDLVKKKKGLLCATKVKQASGLPDSVADLLKRRKNKLNT